MKNLLPIGSLIIGITLFSIQCSAQTASSQLAYEAVPNAKKTTASTQSNLAAVVTQSFENKFNVGVHIENKEEGKFTVKLKSASSVLHKEIIKNKTYVRRYDMYNLPVGDYEIEVDNGKDVFTQKITIKKNNGVRVLSLH
ncbi:hypothetical protein GXP67_10240 [Rhodocytophaga rosea]|uniref:Por secretion system C-terminal sorting domain-containing protein n=1 Tax=Rhodocytophaga rosea TaxID=2704465 RepID=A0A6C0GGG1_9BACT|nr:hypothetical protein [Rhodocytophaga rosea]QHT66999.1 hypothetical protein GXP67_10240 [Rhodocytophaga rosea]